MDKAATNPYWRQVALGGNSGAAERHARSQAARQRIMIAAAGLFGQHGYRVVSFGMIAASSGLPKGSLTSHFSSKLLLARAIVSEMRGRWEQMCLAADEQGLDPLETLLAEARQVIAVFPTDPVMMGGIRLSDSREVVPNDSDSHYVFGELRARNHLRNAAAAGLLLPSVDVDSLARLVIALLTGHGTVVARHPDTGPSLADRMDETWRVVLPAVTSPDWYSQWLNSQLQRNS